MVPVPSYLKSKNLVGYALGYHTISAHPSVSLPFAMVSNPPENDISPIISLETDGG